MGKNSAGLFAKMFGVKMGADYMSFCRKIDGVRTGEKICSLIFENGPCLSPCEPESDYGKTVFEVVTELLDRYGAKGTFAVIGSTAECYPDEVGADGGGLKYAHFPLFESDELGGVFTHEKEIKALVSAGHEIVNHSCAHLPFGKQGAPRGRVCHGSLPDIIEDLAELHHFCKERFNTKIKLCIPPNDVTYIDGRHSAYDVLTLMRYNYLGGAYNCGGSVPLSDGLEAEVKAMVNAIADPLFANENAFCGKMIRIHDGLNYEGRSPLTDALPQILELLDSKGYKIVTASTLISASPFSDIAPSDDSFADAIYLMNLKRPVAYRDNTIRPKSPITRGEAAMMIAPQGAVLERIATLAQNKNAPSLIDDMPLSHPYSSAARWAQANSVLQLSGGKFKPNRLLTRGDFNSIISSVGGRISPLDNDIVTRAEFMKYLVRAIKKEA